MLDLINVCSNHVPLNCGEESKNNFAVYDSDAPVTLKQGHRHQTWYELQDLEQGYNHSKFDRYPVNSVHQNVNVKDFVKSENTSVISLECVQKVKIVVYSLST